MKSGKWKLGILAAMALAAATFLPQAQATIIVSLSSAPATVTAPGVMVGVDIIVDSAPSAAGGFFAELDYGNLTFVAYLLGPSGTLGPAPFDMSLGDSGGTLSLEALADLAVPDEAALFALQNSGGPFIIAHIDFTGIAVGDFMLELREMDISNFDGTALLCGYGTCTGKAPEPATLLLLGSALGAVAITRRRKQRLG